MTEKRKGYKDIQQQVEADKRWNEKNREHRNYLTYRGTARSFIRNKATQEDLNELKILIQEREEQLKYTE
ncbi:hypothetical protein KG091_05810 [Carnobacteriaceae bacterium zg-ZUI78]|nr:hypothetical protein [Carnobacteriaceae bacterium zg-ZUI78]